MSALPHPEHLQALPEPDAIAEVTPPHPEDEAQHVAVFRARHLALAAQGDAVVLLDDEAAHRIAQADAASLAHIRSATALRSIGTLIAAHMENPAYAKGLEAVDFQALATAKELKFEWDIHKIQEDARQQQRFARQVVLADHGSAPYQFEPGQPLTYFMRYRNAENEHAVVWGRQIEEALKRYKVEVGDKFWFRRTPAAPGIDGLTPDKTSIEPKYDAARFEMGVTEKASDALSPQTPEMPPAPPEEIRPARPQPVPLDARDLSQLAERRRQDSERARQKLGLGLTLGATSPDVSSPPGITTDEPTTAPSQEKSSAPESTSAPNGVRGTKPKERPALPDVLSTLLDGITYQIQKNGSVLYLLHERPVFTDHGDQILIHKEADGDDEAILAALLLAKEKWAGELELTGSDAFKRRALEIMLKHKIEVRLKDPQQEALRRDVQKTMTDEAQTPAVAASASALVEQQRHPQIFGRTFGAERLFIGRLIGRLAL